MKLVCIVQSHWFLKRLLFLPSYLRNNFPLTSRLMPILYLWAKLRPKIKFCFKLVHTIKLCVKFCSSIINFRGAIPIGPNVALLAIFTFNSFLIRLILSVIFLNTCYEIHEHVVIVSNRAVSGSAWRILTSKFDSLSFVYSKFEMMWFCW